MDQTSHTTTSQPPHPPHMPFSPSMPFASSSSSASSSSIFPATMASSSNPATHAAHAGSHLQANSLPHPAAHFFPGTSTFPFQNLEHVAPTDHVERGRTGPASPGQTIKARAHPYSRSPSRATASRDPSRNPASRDPSRNPASRDSSAHRDPGSAGTGGPSTPPRSGRAGVKRRQKYSRTRTGCSCCRARRIKCDEERPVCRRCVIAKKQCQYPDEGSASVSRGNSREDYERGGKSSRSNSGEPDDRKGLNPDGSSDIQGLQQPSTYHDPFNLALPPYGKGPIPDSGPYNFDQPFVGPYDDSGPSGTSALAAGAADNADGVQEGNVTVAGIQQKYASAGGAPMLATPNFLLPWFPTQEERSLILHYCANAADLMMAIPSGLNPMLAINLPLALDSPRGANPAADALRVALLGIGAIHQAFSLARSGVSTTQTTAMFQYASNLRDMGKELVRRAVAEPSGARSDAALGAATALGTIDIFFGGEGWMDNFNVAKEMVAYRGGPAAMLKASKPKQLAEGVTISPARLMLEILAIYDTFGSSATGEEPSFLGEQNESWWFEGSQSTYEEHSVEKQFGMSRVMVHSFSRLTRSVARVDRSEVAITESDNGADGERPPTPTTAWLSSLMKASGTMLPIVAEARKSNADVDAWIDSLQSSTLEHERVQVGNRAYAFAMKILLLRRVFKYPRDDLRVQTAANEVLRHCSTSTAILGMSIDLMWPAIIAGCCVEGDARQWSLTSSEGFKSQCCFDVETASRIIQESWRRVDAKDPRDDWKEVCEDFGSKVSLC